MAANPILRPVPVYVGSAKIGEGKSGSFQINPNVALEPAQDETGISCGVVTCEVDLDTIMPVAGMKTSLLAMSINQTQVSVQLYVDAGFVTFEGIISGANVKWDVAKGSCDGNWKFIGASPSPNPTV